MSGAEHDTRYDNGLDLGPKPGRRDAGVDPDDIPPIDPATIRLAVVQLAAVVAVNVPWPLRLAARVPVTVPLFAARPDWEDPSKPPCVASSLQAEPRLVVGTVDQLTEAYRAELLAVVAQANGSADGRGSLYVTQTAFGDSDPGPVPPIFGGSVR